MRLGELLSFVETLLVEHKLDRDAEVYVDGWELDHANVGVCPFEEKSGLFLVSVEQAEEDEEQWW